MQVSLSIKIKMIMLLLYGPLQVELALKVLASIKNYYDLIKNDISTTGVVIKKVILESCCGEEITSSNLMNQLALFLGARRGTVFECSRSRVKLQQQKELIPVMQRLARNPISGDNIISPEWKVTVAGWYESYLRLWRDIIMCSKYVCYQQ